MKDEFKKISQANEVIDILIKIKSIKYNPIEDIDKIINDIKEKIASYVDSIY